MELKGYKTEIIKDTKSKFDFFQKILVMGDIEVGKTSIIKQLINNEFIEEYEPTKGYNFNLYFIKVNNIVIKCQIWDMCGAENYRPNALQLYRNANLGILVYSVTSKSSFNSVENWIIDMEKKNPGTKIILLGNKSDLNDQREVSFEEGKGISEKYNLEYFTEISATKEFSSPNFMERGAICLYKDYENNNDVSGYGMSESIMLEPPKPKRRLFC